MAIRLRCLFLFLPVNDISDSKNRWMSHQLQRLLHLDQFIFGECFGSKGLSDEGSIWFRTRGDNLLSCR